MTEHTPKILSPRLQRLAGDLQLVGKSALHDFWAEITKQGTPLIEADVDGYSLVTFLWQHHESVQNIAVIQDWGADGIREHHMCLMPNSNVWYLTRRLPSDTRTTYQLSPSSSLDPNERAPYQIDPLNRQTFTGFLSADGEGILFSYLELPDAPLLPWRQAVITKPGTVRLHTPLEDQRRLWLYTPDVALTTPLPVLIVFDGQLYKDQLRLPHLLDYLISKEQIPPVAALMIDSLDRTELLCQPDFAAYITGQVLPWLRSTYAITAEPQQTVVLGCSLGGLAAVFLAYSYPTIFAKVLAQSGWFRWHPEEDSEHHWLARQMAAAPKFAIDFVLQVGNLEVAKMADGGPSQLEANQYMRDALRAKGYGVTYQEYSGGHDVVGLEFPLAQGLMSTLFR